MSIYPVVIRVEPLHGYQNISGSAMHNLRLAGDLSHVDRSRTHLNKIYYGDENVVSNIKEIEEEFGRARKDGTLAFEMMCTAHQNFFKDKSPEFIDRWAQATTDFAIKRFGKKAVVQSFLHLDEEAPHVHLTIVPLAKTSHTNRHRTTTTLKINYSQCIGIPKGGYPKGTTPDEKRTGVLQTEYAAHMAPFGLVRGATKPKGSKKNVSPSAYRQMLADDYNNITNELERIDTSKGKSIVVLESRYHEIFAKLVALKTHELKLENESLNTRNDALENVIQTVSTRLGCPSPAQLPIYCQDLVTTLQKEAPDIVKDFAWFAEIGATEREQEESMWAEQMPSALTPPRRKKGERKTKEERREARSAKKACPTWLIAQKHQQFNYEVSLCQNNCNIVQ